MRPFPTGLVFAGGRVAGPPQTELLGSKCPLYCLSSQPPLASLPWMLLSSQPCSPPREFHFIYKMCALTLPLSAWDLVCECADCVWCLPVAEKPYTQMYTASRHYWGGRCPPVLARSAGSKPTGVGSAEFVYCAQMNNLRERGLQKGSKTG